jgi:peptidoglycan DL-endopeptidase CwlO
VSRRWRRRWRRWLRHHRVSGRFVASAVALGVALAVVHGQGHHAPATTATTAAAAPSSAAASAIGYARAELGKPYLWGGTGPGAFDCSGLVMQAWAHAGVAIPRTSQGQWAALPHITEGQLQPGDLVFYTGALEPGEAPPGHVVMYLGGGQIIEAYATGYPIRITALRSDAWGFAHVGAR